MFFIDFPICDYRTEIDSLETGDPEVQFLLRSFFIFQVRSDHSGVPGQPELMFPED